MFLYPISLSLSPNSLPHTIKEVFVNVLINDSCFHIYVL